MTPQPPFPGAGEVFALACGIMWAGAIVMFRRAGEGLAVFQTNLLKNTVAAACFTLTLPLAGVSFLPPGIEGREVWITILSGFLGITLADLLLLKALRLLGATLTTIFSTTYAPIMVLFSVVFLGDRAGPFLLLGGALVVGAGVVGAMQRDRLLDLSPGRALYGGFLVVGQIVMLAASIVMVDATLEKSALWVSWLRLTAGMAGMLLIMPLRRRGLAELVDAFRPRPGWSWVVAGGALGNWVACWAWLAAFAYTSNTRASVLNELHLVFVFILAALFLDEPFTRRRLLAVLLAFLGAVLTLTGGDLFQDGTV